MNHPVSTSADSDPKHLHRAFDLSFTHTEGRWARPGSWSGRTFPDVKMFQELAVTAERGGIRPIICINKIDLIEPADLMPLVGVYAQLGYDVLMVSATTGLLTDTPRMSACICMHSSFAVTPPSTLSTSSFTPESFSIASATSLLW